MKIAFIGQKGIPAVYGGIERHVEELSLRLVESGHDITVYTRPHYTSLQKNKHQGIKLISLPSIHTKNLDAISHTFIASIHAIFSGYNLIHYHGVGPALLCWLPRLLKPRVKVVATFHCIDRQHQKWGKLARFMLWLGEWMICKFAHEVITVSRALHDYTYEVYGRETNYIPNGINQVQNIPASQIKEQFNLNGQDYILAVSRLVRHKGMQYLIRAFRQIPTNLKLVIVGDSAFTDDYVAELKDLAKGDERIIFTGFQSGRVLAELYSNAFVYVHPSESEGLPIVVLEAASYGNCVLASDIPANREIVKYCGLSFNNKDVVDLRQKLQTLILNPAEVAATGKVAREFVLKHFNWQDIGLATDQLYRRIYLEADLKLINKYSASA